MSLFPVTNTEVGAVMMAAADRATLRQAVKFLEHRSLATRLSLVFGRQISLVGKMLPAQLSEVVDKTAERAIRMGLAAAMNSLDSKRRDDRRIWHKAAATVSGAAGGAFGIASLPIELPISTLLMLRSIAAIARTEGENLAETETALACLEVFALGSQEGGEHGAQASASTESGYFALRALLAHSVTEAARFIVERGVIEETAPVMLRFVSQVATRFGVVVSQKVAAQAVPFLGAAGGAAINYAFIDHFQVLARGHFIVRRLERIYGADLVRMEFDAARREVSEGLATSGA